MFFLFFDYSVGIINCYDFQAIKNKNITKIIKIKKKLTTKKTTKGTSIKPIDAVYQLTSVNMITSNILSILLSSTYQPAQTRNNLTDTDIPTENYIESMITANYSNIKSYFIYLIIYLFI